MRISLRKPDLGKRCFEKSQSCSTVSPKLTMAIKKTTHTHQSARSPRHSYSLGDIFYSPDLNYDWQVDETLVPLSHDVIFDSIDFSRPVRSSQKPDKASPEFMLFLQSFPSFWVALSFQTPGLEVLRTLQFLRSVTQSHQPSLQNLPQTHSALTSSSSTHKASFDFVPSLLSSTVTQEHK